MVTTGLDKNGNGSLDASADPESNEVTSSRYLCNDQNVVFVDDDSASATEDGSRANPFKTIQAAIDSANDGSVIYVRAGIYTTGFQIVNRTSLTVRGEGAGVVIAPTTAMVTGIGHKSTANYQTPVFVNGSVGITIESLSLTTGTLAWGPPGSTPSRSGTTRPARSAT